MARSNGLSPLICVPRERSGMTSIGGIYCFPIIRVFIILEKRHLRHWTKWRSSCVSRITRLNAGQIRSCHIVTSLISLYFLEDQKVWRWALLYRHERLTNRVSWGPKLADPIVRIPELSKHLTVIGYTGNNSCTLSGAEKVYASLAAQAWGINPSYLCVRVVAGCFKSNFPEFMVEMHLTWLSAK